jgi:hypothetical protein
MWISTALRFVHVAIDSVVIPVLEKRVPQDEIVVVKLALSRVEWASLRARHRDTVDGAINRFNELRASGAIPAEVKESEEPN